MKKKPTTKAKAPAKKRVPREPDVNQLAHQLVSRSTQADPLEAEPLSQSDISRVMAELGRRGGQIGGKRRAQRMTEEDRSRAASVAAKARWANRQP